MHTARLTEGGKPIKKANIQRSEMMQKDWMSAPYLICLRGCKRNSKKPTSKPICNP